MIQEVRNSYTIVKNKQKIEQLEKDLDRKISETKAQIERLNQENIRLSKSDVLPDGTRVRLQTNWAINPPCELKCWSSCAHFMNPSNVAEIAESYILPDTAITDNCEIRYSIIFETETWIDSEGNVNPVSEKHMFGGIKREWLELAQEAPGQLKLELKI